MKVAIAGYGQEGEVSYKYWSELGAEITIFDEKTPAREIPKGVETYFAPDAFTRMQGFDLIVRTAGLSPAKITTDSKIWSATNEFFAKCPAEIVGVTGTKGKGTTSSLIAEILKAAGKTVHLLGNIGVPALSVLPSIHPEDIVVFELSSFQLWDLEKSPQTAVVLMIEPDHMDVHASMEEYIGAKAHITRFQSKDDLVVYHPTNQYSAQVAAQSPGLKKQYLTKEGGAYVVDGKIMIGETTVAQTKEVGLIGAHNLENICAALIATKKYTQDTEVIHATLKSFKGLPHRLEFVRELQGVKYYNDSFSSAPGATVAAIRSFVQPIILICGGYDKQVNLSAITDAASQAGNIKKVLLMGQTKQTLAQLFINQNANNYEVIESTDFTEIIKRAQAISQDGDVIVLSPGCASFDMFKNFYDRGEQFKKIVNEL